MDPWFLYNCVCIIFFVLHESFYYEIEVKILEIEVLILKTKLKQTQHPL